jgi:hypothetical protein
MLRKHLNSIDHEFYREDQVPFYAWQCITLQLRHRDVDLVIKDDHQMNDLLMVLISAMETVDGNRGSFQTIEELIIDNKVKLKLE